MSTLLKFSGLALICVANANDFVTFDELDGIAASPQKMFNDQDSHLHKFELQSAKQGWEGFLKKSMTNAPENWSKFFGGHEHLPKNFEHISNNCVNQKQLVCDDPNCKAFPFFDEGGLGSGGSYGKDDGTCRNVPCWCVTWQAVGASTTCEEIKTLCERGPLHDDTWDEYNRFDKVGEQQLLDGDKLDEYNRFDKVGEQQLLDGDKFHEVENGWDKVGQQNDPGVNRIWVAARRRAREQNKIDDSLINNIGLLRKGHTPTLILMYGKN